MKNLKLFETFFKDIDKVRLNVPCTIFAKDDKHLRDIKITKDDENTLSWKSNTEYIRKVEKTGTINKSDITDISYQND